MQDSDIASPAQQQRALWLSTFAFTVCFAVWTIFSIIGIQVKKDLGLNETAFGLLIATPILTVSLTRLFLGIWAEQYGGRRVLTLVMLASAAATWSMTWAHSYLQFMVAALFVGLAGGSFSVGVAYVSKWFPPGRQGTALGIFGAGNVGAAVTKLLAPMVMVVRRLLSAGAGRRIRSPGCSSGRARRRTGRRSGGSGGSGPCGRCPIS